jgi:phospholipase C
MGDQKSRVSRRSALKGLGAGVAVASGCMPPDRCAGPLTDERAAPASAEQAEARRRLEGIDTFVVLMFENRSFDHIFGALSLDAGYPDRARVDGLTGDEWNPALDGQPVRVHRSDEITTKGPSRNWDVAHSTFNGGLNNGFVRANPPPHDIESMAYHDRGVAPLHYALADRYAVCDRWFASVMGPTWPNRFYLHAASSNGRINNLDVGSGEPLSVWERMAERCRTAKNYYAGVVAWYSLAFAKRAIGGGGALIPERIESFFRDARQGTLPNFSIIDPDFHLTDLHPPHTFSLAEPFLGAVVRAIEESPQWERTMLVVTFDEHGGFFDHVPPPITADARPEFRQLGFRVPTVVIGPSVFGGRVVSTPFEHVSVLSTLRTRFGIESLGARMDAATDLSSCIDPDRLESTTPRLRDDPPLSLHPDLLRACCSWESSQEELDVAVRSGRLAAPFVDLRPVDQRLADWLGPAQDLGAVRIRR